MISGKCLGFEAEPLTSQSRMFEVVGGYQISAYDLITMRCVGRARWVTEDIKKTLEEFVKGEDQIYETIKRDNPNFDEVKPICINIGPYAPYISERKY